VLLEFSGLQDVLDDDSLGVEKIAQEAAVATPKELLGTHDRSPLASSDSKDLLDAQVELLGQHVVGIATKADALKTLIGREIPTGTMPTPPQGLYPGIFDISTRQLFLKIAAVEMGKLPRAREAANIDKSPNLELLQQSKKTLH
jgi:hypothetical protein